MRTFDAGRRHTGHVILVVLALLAASLLPTGDALASDGMAVRGLDRACPEAQVPPAGFADVAADSPFARPIECLLWYRITSGTTATTYAPLAAVTRQQVAVFLRNLLEDLIVLPDPPATSAFSDVPATGGFGEAINVLASDALTSELGVRVISGRPDGTFDPSGRVTRAQMASLVHRVIVGLAAYDGATIEEGDCGDPARPDQGCFADETSIPAAHRPSVASLHRFGIVGGYADGSYGPADDVSRGQMAAFLTRTIDLLVEGGVAVTPDAYTTLWVDQGDADGSCDTAVADGSAGRPFCAVQPAIDRAATMIDDVVDVVVVGHADRPYLGGVQLRSGTARQVDVVGLGVDDPDGLAVIAGPVRIDGDEGARNELRDLHLQGPDVGPAVEVTSAGVVRIGGSVVRGEVGLLVDQPATGWIQVADGVVGGESVAVDLVATRIRTDATGTSLRDLYLRDASTAFVRLPDDSATSIATADAWLNDAASRIGFSTDAEVATVAGRRVIRPLG